MSLLLQLSDPHFGTARPPVMKALQELSWSEQPEALIVSGDITQRAAPEQFTEAKRFCDSLRIPHLLALPGNHDIALVNAVERIFNPYGAYLKAFGPALETSIESPEWLVIGVNTTRWWRHKNGEVSSAQVERVAAQLAGASARQLRVVVVHQPVYVLQAEDEQDRLRGWELAVRKWAIAGADIIMGGHIHLPYVRELSALMPGLTRRLWCVQAGTAVSSRTRQGIDNSVNLLRQQNADSDACWTLERWDYRQQTEQFERCTDTQILPAR